MIGEPSSAARLSPRSKLRLVGGMIRLGERAGGRSMMDEAEMEEAESDVKSSSGSSGSPASSSRSRSKMW